MSKFEVGIIPVRVFTPFTDDMEGWWVNSPEEIFGSSLTATATPILQSELDNCLELLQLEPDNKCELYCKIR